MKKHLITALVPALLAAGSVRADGDFVCEGEYRYVNPVEAAALTTLAADLLGRVPAAPAGWTRVVRPETLDPTGHCIKAGDPIPMSLAVELRHEAGYTERQLAIQAAVEEAMASQDLEAQSARVQKEMDAFTARIQAAIAAGDQAAIQAIQREMEALMNPMKASGKRIEAAQEAAFRKHLADTRAEVRFELNPAYGSMAHGPGTWKRLETPAGLEAYEIDAPDELGTEARHNGSIRIVAVLGAYRPVPRTDGAIEFRAAGPRAGIPPQGLHGLWVTVEATPERARALFAGLDLPALAARAR